jgi:hypothetical protein
MTQYSTTTTNVHSIAVSPGGFIYLGDRSGAGRGIHVHFPNGTQAQPIFTGNPQTISGVFDIKFAPVI